MAEFEEPVQNEEMAEEETKPKKISFVKVGIPIIIVQIVVAYFLASHVIVPMLWGNPPEKEAQPVAAEQQSGGSETSSEDDFGVIYQLEDIIVNPAGSQGSQFLLVNLAFELKSDSDVEVLKKREVQVRDILIRLISGKTILDLDGPDDKERLREEIKTRIANLLPEGHLRNVYFSNYIIQ